MDLEKRPEKMGISMKVTSLMVLCKGEEGLFGR